MGLLSRLREWLTGSAEEASGAADPEEAGDAAAEPRLDPENVTEVRTGSEDDPVEKLQELRDEQEDDAE